MAITFGDTLNRDKFAYDLSKTPLTKNDVFDIQAINQSIENILSTIPGERPMNPFFGSPLFTTLFENITQSEAEKLMNDLIDTIKFWENRITVIPEQCEFNINSNDHTLEISIVYQINQNNIVSEFNRKVIF
jgi:phage baseplate assembly protein W